MNAEIALAAAFVFAIGLGSYGWVLHRRRLAIEARRAHARYIRETPFSVRVGLTDEEMSIMPREVIDQLMRPEDMSQVRSEMEQLEQSDEFKELLADSQRKQNRTARPSIAAHIEIERRRQRASLASASGAPPSHGLTQEELDAMTPEELELFEQSEKRRRGRR